MFREHIQAVIDRLEGGIGGIVMGFDGIAVESYSRDGAAGGIDVETLGMELSHVVSQMRKATEMLEATPLSEVVVRAGKFTAVIHGLNDEYFLALALAPDGNLGKARFLARLAVPKIRQEL